MIINNRSTGIVGYTLEEVSPISIEKWTKYIYPDDLENGHGMISLKNEDTNPISS